MASLAKLSSDRCQWTLLMITDKSTLAQEMAWCCQPTSYFLNQCWPRSMSPRGFSRPQWDNMMKSHTQTVQNQNNTYKFCKKQVMFMHFSSSNAINLDALCFKYWPTFWTYQSCSVLALISCYPGNQYASFCNLPWRDLPVSVHTGVIKHTHISHSLTVTLISMAIL